MKTQGSQILHRKSTGFKPCAFAMKYLRKAVFMTSLIGLTIMVAYHAYTLDVTNDEAYSFFLLKTEYYRALFGTANTHWLNSILMKIEMLVLGDAPFVWRLHSVLAFPFFCVSVYRVTGFIRNDALAIICYSLIVLNPYVLDWFVLARGYGLALTFQVWVLYYLFLERKTILQIVTQQGAERFTKSFYVWTKILLLCALMLAANLSYFYTFLGITSVFLLYIFTNKINNLSNKKIIILAIGFVVLLFGAMANLWFVRQNDPSMYGGNELVYSIFGTVWEAFFYQANYGGIAVVLSWLTILLLFIFGVISTLRFIKNRQITSAFSATVIISVLLILNIIFHVIFDAPYLANRTALQWWIPGMLLIFLFLDDVETRMNGDAGAQKTYKVSKNLIGLTVSTILAIHLFAQFNPHIVYEWRDASHSKQIINDLHELKAKNAGLNKYVLGVFSNYYQITDKRFFDLKYQHLPEKKLANCTTKEWDAVSNLDYIIVSFDETIDCLQRRNVQYEIIKQYDNHRIISLQSK